jgi:hypothetical protein
MLKVVTLHGSKEGCCKNRRLRTGDIAQWDVDGGYVWIRNSSFSVLIALILLVVYIIIDTLSR